MPQKMDRPKYDLNISVTNAGNCSDATVSNVSIFNIKYSC